MLHPACAEELVNIYMKIFTMYFVCMCQGFCLHHCRHEIICSYFCIFYLFACRHLCLRCIFKGQEKYSQESQLLMDWLILTACQLFLCYFIRSGKGITFIVYLYLHFLWSCFLIIFFLLYMALSNTNYFKQIYLSHRLDLNWSNNSSSKYIWKW